MKNTKKEFFKERSRETSSESGFMVFRLKFLKFFLKLALVSFGAFLVLM